MLKTTFIILLLFSFCSGCGTIVRHLDSTWTDHRTVYKKSKPLPPLEIPPELAAPRIPFKKR